MTVSCVVITLNEEANLGRCLESVRGLADEIVVVDSGSTDGTEAIARAHGARWHTQAWLGYVGQKNLALSLATREWILLLDADEELAPALRAELETIKSRGPAPGVTAYSMPRCVLYDGRWIRHGDWYPDRLVRFFQRGSARYAGGRVHERLEHAGTAVRLEGDIHHYSFRDEADHRDRARKYARLWADQRIEEGRRCGPLAPWTHSAFRWIRGYLLRRGFLDGKQGWRIAALCAWEVHLKYSLLRRGR